jgi:hypothetical protein
MQPDAARTRQDLYGGARGGKSTEMEKGCQGYSIPGPKPVSPELFKALERTRPNSLHWAPALEAPKMTTPLIKCYLVEDKSPHEGSGGGFSVVRFIHFVVENRTPVLLRSVKVPYRLMKGDECFQEDFFAIDRVAPGDTRRSETFIRESAVFDRVEWAGPVSVEADQTIPHSWIKFNGAIPGRSRTGCAIAAALLLLAGGAAYLFLLKG